MNQLKIDNLFKSYDNHEILHGISFTVEQGQFVSLLGPSGCGKTTTLRCIAGLEQPDAKSGAIGFTGSEKNSEETLSAAGKFVPPEKRRFGMVFQSYAVWPHMNVFDNVAFPLRMSKLDRAEVEKKVGGALALVHLTGLEKRFGHELSGGQQQRVALARALAMSPRLLLLDEPLSNLDALLREELRVEIGRIQKQLKITTILVTHDQREALSLSDKIILMKDGRIDAQGTPGELYSRPPTNFVSEFLLGGQLILHKSGEKKLLLPRRWKRKENATAAPFKLLSRLYLGTEFEYWAENDEWKQPIKFYDSQQLELSEPVSLVYV